MKVYIITNKTRKQGIPRNTPKIYPLLQYWVLVVPHIRTLVTYCQKVWFNHNFVNIIKKFGIVLRYLNKVKSRHVIGLPTVCEYQHFDEKIGYNVRTMFVQSYCSLLVLYNILHGEFVWKFYHFTCLHIMEGGIVHNRNKDHDKYLSIYVWGKSGG